MTKRLINKKIAGEFIGNGGNAKGAVKIVQPELTDGSAEVKGHRLLRSDSFWQDINDLSADLGFTVNDAMKLLVEKARKGDKESLKALQTWFDVTGNKSPTKTESKQDITASVTQKEAENVAEIARQALRDSLN